MSDNRKQTRFRTDELSVAANDEDRAEKSSAVNMPVHFVWDYTKWKSRKKNGQMDHCSPCITPLP